MYRTDAELTVLENAANEVFEQSLQQLSDLELASIGGGIADPILA
jgi:hypothetical protein